jgi:spore coat protein CotF
MENYLLIIKSTIEVYVHGTLESSNREVKDILKYGLDEMLMHQERCYDEMVNNNWYVVENVSSSTIDKTLKKINKS